MNDQKRTNLNTIFYKVAGSDEINRLTNSVSVKVFKDVKDVTLSKKPNDKSYFNKAWFAKRNINISIADGESVAILGESGSGKSTLVQGLLRLIDSEGDIFYHDCNLQGMDLAQMRQHRQSLQIVFQDPYGSLSPRMSVQQIISEGLEVQGQHTDQQILDAVKQALRDVGLPDDAMQRYPHQFSGGQRQRIAIARALVLKPKVLILDEPTSALDRTVQKQILALLQDLQQRYQLSYIFITHDLSVVRAVSHRVLVLKSGKIVEQGKTEDIFTAPQQAYTQELLEAATFASRA